VNQATRPFGLQISWSNKQDRDQDIQLTTHPPQPRGGGPAEVLVSIVDIQVEIVEILQDRKGGSEAEVFRRNCKCTGLYEVTGAKCLAHRHHHRLQASFVLGVCSAGAIL